MVDPEVRDWERLRKEIPAIESKSIDNAMVDCHAFVNQPYITDTTGIHPAVEDDEVVFTGYPEDYEEDFVNNPSHYTIGKVECIEAIEESMSTEAYKGYLKGNCMKYLWRYETKHADKPVEDLEKAQWYLARLLQEMVFEEGNK